MITAKVPEVSDVRVGDGVLVTNRIHEMQPETSENLDRFLASYEITGRYLLLPVIFRASRPDLLMDLGIGKYKLTVKRADEIGPGDVERVAKR